MRKPDSPLEQDQKSSSSMIWSITRQGKSFRRSISSEEALRIEGTHEGVADNRGRGEYSWRSKVELSQEKSDRAHVVELDCYNHTEDRTPNVKNIHGNDGESESKGKDERQHLSGAEKKSSLHSSNIMSFNQDLESGIQTELGATSEGSLEDASNLRPPELLRGNQSLPGAVAIRGIGNDARLETNRDFGDETTTIVSSADSASESASVPILNARIVHEDAPCEPISPYVEAKPMEDTPIEKPNSSQNRRKNRLISMLLFLVVVAVAAVITLFTTRNGASASENSSGASTVDPVLEEFMKHLTPLLSATSLSALNNPDSAQARAMRWAVEGSIFRDLPFQRQLQRYALATLYFSTAGEGWEENTDWLSDKDECTWIQFHLGGQCNEDGSLRIMKMPGNDLSGVLPGEITLLSSLEELDLSRNDLTGTIPTFTSLWTNLHTLNLSDNDHTGPIPPDIGAMTSLKILDLSHCHLMRDIPSSIGNLTVLESLNIAGNELTGNLPSELGLASRLRQLDLSQNELSGPIPSQIGELSELFYMSLHTNALSGSIPSEIGRATNLETLYLQKNDLNGTAPTTIASLHRLQELLTHDNKLSGAIPSVICGLSTSYVLLPQHFQVDCGRNTCACCTSTSGNTCAEVNSFMEINTINNTTQGGSSNVTMTGGDYDADDTESEDESYSRGKHS